MAVTVTSTPQLWESAYKPLEWRFTSTKLPNTEPGESAIPVAQIRRANAADVLTFPTLQSGDTLVIHSPISNVSFGDFIEISGTQNGLYSGEFRVLKTPSPNYTVIQSPWLGDDSDGLMTKLYRNYTLYVDVELVGHATRRYKLKPDPSGEFVLDISSFAQATFTSPLDKITTGAGTTMYGADGAIAMRYDFTVFEGYEIPDDNGVMTFTQFNRIALAVRRNFKVVNNVHQYNRVDQYGDVDFDWNTKLIETSGAADYVIAPGGTANKSYFLTFMPITKGLPKSADTQASVRMGVNDEMYLAWLQSDQGAGVRSYIRIREYNSSNVNTFTRTIAFNNPDRAGIIAIGPKNLSRSGYLAAGTTYYRVELTNEDLDSISFPVYVTVDRTCSEASHTMHWLNKMGGVDSFNFHYRDSQLNTAQRKTLKKPSQAFSGSGWMMRTLKVDPARIYSAKADIVTPEVTAWLANDMFESVDVRQIAGDGNDLWNYVIIVSDQMVAQNEVRNRNSRPRVDYMLGTDNRSHRI